MRKFGKVRQRTLATAVKARAHRQPRTRSSRRKKRTGRVMRTQRRPRAY